MLPETLLSQEQTQALSQFIAVLDYLAVAVFAISGALVAARREMDLLSFVFIGTVTGIGGGTLRDLILGVRPVFWVTQPQSLMICIVASVATFWAARLLSSRYRALLWMDAVGVGMYAVTGAHKAAILGAAPVVCTLMGVMTAAFGGLMRDIMCGERSLLFNREVYATAAIAGASTYLLLRAFDLPLELQAAGGFCVGFGLRAGAILWGWSLPAYRRPSLPLDGPDGRSDDPPDRSTPDRKDWT